MKPDTMTTNTAWRPETRTIELPPIPGTLKMSDDGTDYPSLPVALKGKGPQKQKFLLKSSRLTILTNPTTRTFLNRSIRLTEMPEGCILSKPRRLLNVPGCFPKSPVQKNISLMLPTRYSAAMIPRHGCRPNTALLVWSFVITLCGQMAHAEVLQGNFAVGAFGSAQFSLAFSTSVDARLTTTVSHPETPQAPLPHDSMLRIRQTLHQQLDKLTAICGNSKVCLQPPDNLLARPDHFSNHMPLAQSHWQTSSYAVSVLNSSPITTAQDRLDIPAAQAFACDWFCGQRSSPTAPIISTDELSDRTIVAAAGSLLQPYADPFLNRTQAAGPATLPQAIADSFRGTTQTIQSLATGQRNNREP